MTICWKGINYLSKIDDWETFEKNNLTIALNNLYINLNCKKQVILLMIPNEKKEGWYYSAVKELSTLL